MHREMTNQSSQTKIHVIYFVTERKTCFISSAEIILTDVVKRLLLICFVDGNVCVVIMLSGL